MNTLELLLKMDIPNLPEAEYKVKRLSQLCGEDVVFRLRALPYSRCVELYKLHEGEQNIHIILAGIVDSVFKSEELKARYNAETPAELVKKMLLPGEIEDLSRVIERLSGYRTNTIEEIKKN